MINTVIAQAGANSGADPLGDFIQLAVLVAIVVVGIAWLAFSVGRLW